MCKDRRELLGSKENKETSVPKVNSNFVFAEAFLVIVSFLFEGPPGAGGELGEFGEPGSMGDKGFRVSLQQSS